jgi:hypothetical protein
MTQAALGDFGDDGGSTEEDESAGITQAPAPAGFESGETLTRIREGGRIYAEVESVPAANNMDVYELRVTNTEESSAVGVGNLITAHQAAIGDKWRRCEE